jgi:hypothetical protein
MTDAQTLPVLQQVVQRESRSLLQYIREAFPWTTAGDHAAWTQLQQLIDEQRQGVGALVQFLTRRLHTFPYLGSYPAGFTTVNFVALDHLLPLLVDEQRQAVTALEQALLQLSDSEARGQVQTYLEMKRRHLKNLETLAPAHPEPAIR